MSSAARRPLFLVASERSGTTMLGLMLGQHPDLAWLGEMDFATRYLAADGSPPLVADYLRWIRTDRGYTSCELEPNATSSFADLVVDFLDQQRRRDGKSHVGATVHQRFDNLPRYWPEARFVYLLRDGRDVTRSSIQMGWAGNMWTGASRWLEAEACWQRLQAATSADQCLEVRYEELVQRPVEVLQRICAHAGLDYHQDMLRYDEVSTYSKPDPSLAQQWRRKLSQHELQLAEARLGPKLVERGYELSGLPPLSISGWQATALRAQCKFRRSEFRVRRYGLPLVFADWLTRHLGWRWANEPVRLRMNTVDVRYLK